MFCQWEFENKNENKNVILVQEGWKERVERVQVDTRPRYLDYIFILIPSNITSSMSNDSQQIRNKMDIQPSYYLQSEYVFIFQSFNLKISHEHKHVDVIIIIMTSLHFKTTSIKKKRNVKRCLHLSLDAKHEPCFIKTK